MNITLPRSQKVFGVLIVGVAIVVTSGILNYTNKAKDVRPTEATPNPTPVGDTLDTDHDGAPDWEERLFGTDIHKIDTDGDGINDPQEIADQKQKFTIHDPAESELTHDVIETKTELVAKDLLGTVLTRSELGIYDPKRDNEKIIAQALEKTKNLLYTKYTKDDVKKTTVETSSKRAEQYRSDIIKVLEPMLTLKNSENELEIYARATEKNDPAEYARLAEYAKMYASIAENLASVEVPDDALEQHLSLMNALSYVSASINGMSKGFDDIIGSYASVGHLGKAEDELHAAYVAYATYFLIKKVPEL